MTNSSGIQTSNGTIAETVSPCRREVPDDPAADDETLVLIAVQGMSEKHDRVCGSGMGHVAELDGTDVHSVREVQSAQRTRAWSQLWGTLREYGQ